MEILETKVVGVDGRLGIPMHIRQLFGIEVGEFVGLWKHKMHLIVIPIKCICTLCGQHTSNGMELSTGAKICISCVMKIRKGGGIKKW